jgi:4-amino-4-deoxy-L-arabinose transferase-like glycosyltransferase
VSRVSGVFARLGWVGAIVLVGTLARLPRLNVSMMDEKPFRATQTAFTIRWMAKHSLDPLHAHLPILGPPWTVPLEFPLFQLVSAILVRAGLSTNVAGRVVGLVCFEITAVLLFLLVRRIGGRRAAIVALVLYQAVPYGAEFGTVVLIEFMATAFALAAVLCAWRWFDGASVWWLAAGAITSAGVWLVKITTAVPWVLPIAALALLSLWADWRGHWRRVAVGIAAVPGFGLACGLWWTHFADAQKARSPFTQFLMSRNLTHWNFGTTGQRLNAGANGELIGWATEMVTGLWPVAVLAILLILISRRNRLLKISLVLVPVAAVETFFNLYHHNDYYLAAVFPALVAIPAFGADEAAERLAGLRSWASTAAVGGSVALVLATTWPTGIGQDVVQVLDHHRKVPALSKNIAARTPVMR